MVKSRKATIKSVKPLPDLYKVHKLPSASSVHHTPTTVLLNPHHNTNQGTAMTTTAATSSSRSLQSATTSKRSIFHHLTRLQHGILRYRNVAESPTSAASNLQQVLDGKDRKFVYVPADYLPKNTGNATSSQTQNSQNQGCLTELLHALQLSPTLPPLLVVTAATDGAVEESMDEEDDYNMNSVRDFNIKPSPLATSKANEDLEDLTEEEERELLREKTHEILSSTVELCGQLGAWVVPHRPRRANGAAEILGEVLAKSNAAETSTDNNNNNNGSNITHKNKSVVVLGLIGLDQQDRKGGFQDLIVSHAVPVGDDIPRVCEVSYDPSHRDHLPCPELTHLLIFQKRRDMRAFRDDILLQQIPDVMLAFGKTTPYAQKSLCSSLIRQSPVALITHTSKEIDHVSWMLKHADREMRKLQVGAVEAPPTTYDTIGDDGTMYRALPIPPLPELEEVEPELSEFVTTQWPANHDDERVVLADPRKMGGLQFQQEFLRAINAAYYTNQARTVAIHHAQAVLGSTQETCQKQNKITEQWHLAMVSTTLSAVVAAVFYAKIFGSDPPPSMENRNPYQIALFLATLVVPMMIIWMKKRFDASSMRWSTLQKEAALLESALAEFRTRPRTYTTGGQSSSTSSDPVAVVDPVEEFAHAVAGVQTRVASVQSGSDESAVKVEAPAALLQGMTAAVPSATTDTAADDADVEAPPPPSESSPLLSGAGIAPNDLKNARPGDISTKLKASITGLVAGAKARVTNILPGSISVAGFSQTAMSAAAMSSATTAEETDDVEAPPPPNSTDESAPLTLAVIAAKWRKAMPSMDPVEEKDDDYNNSFHHYDTMTNINVDDLEKAKAKVEEGKSSQPVLWTTKQYIAHRIGAERERKQTELQVLEKRHNMMETINKVVVSSTSLFALLSKQWAIPIVLGVSSAFVASQDFRKYQKRLDQGQAMIQELDDLLAWWNVLTVEEKILNSNQDQLVHNAEGIIAADIAFTY